VTELRVVTLCTGNAARSVMAGIMLEQLSVAGGPALEVRTAGTHVIEGQPMSQRVRLALHRLDSLELEGSFSHRSHQLTDEDCAEADLIVAMEADHVAYVRRTHPGAAAKTATLQRLVGSLEPGSEPRSALSALELADVDLADDVDVLDPAGGQQPTYDACAAELLELCRGLLERLGGTLSRP
jgi:protein-tyrosine-phosphatase